MLMSLLIRPQGPKNTAIGFNVSGLGFKSLLGFRRGSFRVVKIPDVPKNEDFGFRIENSLWGLSDYVMITYLYLYSVSIWDSCQFRLLVTIETPRYR